MNNLNIQPITLLKGHHANTGKTGQGCFMDVASYLNGDEVISDSTDCVCKTIGGVVREMNDRVTNPERQSLMLPYVLRAMGTATGDRRIVGQRIEALEAYIIDQFEAAKKSHRASSIIGRSVFTAAGHERRMFYMHVLAGRGGEASVYAARVAWQLHFLVSVADRDAAFIKFMEATCNPETEATAEVVRRAGELVEKNKCSAMTQ